MSMWHTWQSFSWYRVLMEATPVEPTPEQKGLLESLARETGMSVASLLAQVLDKVSRKTDTLITSAVFSAAGPHLRHLRHAYILRIREVCSLLNELRFQQKTPSSPPRSFTFVRSHDMPELHFTAIRCISIAAIPQDGW